MEGNGNMIPGTPIAVDMWDMEKHPEARIFFLTHFHRDHTVGLSKSWKHHIYASPITSKLLVKKFGVKPSLVRSLEFNEDHLIPLDEKGFETITVTLFDANHCPGSAMFLFSGYFGDILYTGDFRYHPEMFLNFDLPTIDVLYLDNTYCSPKCSFPSRDDSMEQILQQIHICLVNNNRVFLGLDNLGKEDLLLKLAKERQCKICVSTSRKEVMEILDMSEIVTTNKSGAKIFVVPTNQISSKNIVKWNEEMKTHAILVTARYCGFNFKPYATSKDIHVIPYSNHSSFLELLKFVKLVRPRSIIPIIKSTKGIFGMNISNRADMSVFQSCLTNSPPSDFTIPDCVKDIMGILEPEIPNFKQTIKRKLTFKSKKYASKSKQPKLKAISAIDNSETESNPTDEDYNVSEENSSPIPPRNEENQILNVSYDKSYEEELETVSELAQKAAGIKYTDNNLISSDSEDCDQEHSNYSSAQNSELKKSDFVWEIIHVSGEGTNKLFS